VLNINDDTPSFKADTTFYKTAGTGLEFAGIIGREDADSGGGY
jgi:hypothetical protein